MKRKEYMKPTQSFTRILLTLVFISGLVFSAAAPAPVKAAGTGTISGTAMDADFNPITDRVIHVAAVDPADTTIELASTDSNTADGTYTISGVPQDTAVAVLASDPSNGYGNECWQESSCRAPITITLTTGDPDVFGIDFTLEPSTSYVPEQLTFNVRGGRWLNDLNIRKAIAYGTNRYELSYQGFLDNSVSGTGPAYQFGPVINTMVPFGFWSQASTSDLTLYPYDPSQAETILDTAGYVDTNADGIREDGSGNPIVLEFVTTNPPMRTATGNLFKAQMLDIGLDVNVTTYAGSFFFNDPASPLLTGDFDVAEFAWVADTNHFDDFPSPLWYTGNFQNYGGYSNAALDTAYDNAIANATDRDLMKTYVVEWQTLMSQDLPILPLFDRFDVTADRAALTAPGTNVTVNPGAGTNVTFDNITDDGSVAAVGFPYLDTDLPAGYDLAGTQVFEIGVSAAFDSAQVCVTYDDTSMSFLDELRVTLFHLQQDLTTWTDITLAGSGDYASNRICGTTTAFTVFAPLIDPSIVIDTGSISGVVKDQNGDPITDQPILVETFAWNGGDSIASVYSDPLDGSYTIANIPLDIPFKVHAWDDDDAGSYYGDEYWQESGGTDITQLTLTSGTPALAGIDFTLNNPPTPASFENLTFNLDPARKLGGADGKTIRKAIAYGIDRGPILNSILATNDEYGYVPNTFVPVGYWAQPARSELFVYPFNKTQAKNLLDGAGWTVPLSGGCRKKAGKTLKLDLITTDAARRITTANMIKANLKDVGICVTVITYPAGEFFGTGGPLYTGNFDIAQFTWVFGADHDDDFPLPMYTTGHADNLGGYSSAAYDSEYDLGHAAVDRDTKKPYIVSAANTLSDDLPSLPLYSRNNITRAAVPTGSNVIVNPLPEITLTFPSVTTAGYAAALSSGIHALDLPPGFNLANNKVYDIGSNAVFTGTPKVCINYDDTGLGADETYLQLYRLTNISTWQIITFSLDTTGNNICGLTPGFSTFAILIPTVLTNTYTSAASYDGWVLESSETSGIGGTINRNGTTLRVGDDSQDRQYRSILSFNTATLPDRIVVLGVELKVQNQGATGTDPFTTHGSLLVDIRKPSFGLASLELGDFQAAANKNGVGTIGSSAIDTWHSAILSALSYKYINATGTTQLRLRFSLDDNDNRIADYLSFSSGNADAVNWPQLIITYFVP
jgi:ABC-type transport system substrate-binding protein